MPIKCTRVGWQDAPSKETPVDAGSYENPTYIEDEP